MAIVSLIISFLLFGLLGAGLYEVIFRRRTQKYHAFLNLVEQGEMTEMPKGYQNEPVKFKGFVYFLVVAGLGWLVIMGFGLLAFGACLVVMTGTSFY
jgi:hypothetical protein